MSMIQRRRKPSFKVPNRLINDRALTFSAGPKQAKCSVTTVRKALEELEDAKYITRTRNRRFIHSKSLVGYDQYTYSAPGERSNTNKIISRKPIVRQFIVRTLLCDNVQL